MFKEDRFCKPKLHCTNSTRYLYCAGIGHEFNSDLYKLQTFFSQFGDLDYSSDITNDDSICIENKEENSISNAVYMIPNRRYTYISYQTIQGAEKAMNYINNCIPDVLIEAIGVGKLCIRYAEKKSNLSKLPEIECTSCTEHINIPGCTLIENFINEMEESKLLDELAGEDSPWKENLCRRVQHYGFPFNYRTLMLDYSKPTLPLPDAAQIIASTMMEMYNSTLINTMMEMYNSTLNNSNILNPNDIDTKTDVVKMDDSPLNQLTINEYLPGQGIASHCDTETCFGPVIFILNLGSGITMNLTKRSDNTVDSIEENHSKCRKNLYLPARSLLVLTGEARYNWMHGISPRRKDKIPYSTAISCKLENEIMTESSTNSTGSITVPMQVSNEAQSSSVLVRRGRRVSLTFRHALKPGSLPPIQLYSNELELDHVVRVYDNIAVHWNHTRGKRKVYWHRVKDFIDSLPPGTLLADIGSGDGKYFGVNPDIITIGCDRSLKLLEVSHDKAYESFCCDAVKLPFISDTFDATLCIAVLHHLSTVDRRYAVISELLRITKPGGTVLIQAWALEQKGVDYESKRVFEDQDTMVPWRLNKRFLLPVPVITNNHNASLTETDEVDEIQINNNNAMSITEDDDHHQDQIQLPGVGDSGPCQHVKEEHGDLVFQRYCHVYKQGELEGLCSSVPGCRLMEAGWDKGNWFVRLEKIHDERLVTIKQGPESRIPVLIARKQ